MSHEGTEISRREMNVSWHHFDMSENIIELFPASGPREKVVSIKRKRDERLAELEAENALLRAGADVAIGILERATTVQDSRDRHPSNSHGSSL